MARGRGRGEVGCRDRSGGGFRLPDRALATRASALNRHQSTARFMRPMVLAFIATIAACASDARPSWDVAQDSTHIVASISGLSGPEAVRYDPDQDVYFVSNFNGEPAADTNGFITRARADGTVESLRFMVGT